MSTIRIADLAAGVIVIGKEESGVTGLVGTLVEQAVDRVEQLWQVVNRHRILTAQVGLEIGHQQCTGKPLPRDIRQYQAKAPRRQLQKVVIVPAHLPCLNAAPNEFQRADWG